MSTHRQPRLHRPAPGECQACTHRNQQSHGRPCQHRRADHHGEKSAEPPPFHYDMLRILIPEPDATLRSSAGELIVSVTSEPGLQSGHRYRLLLDGKATGEPGVSPVFALSNIDRAATAFQSRFSTPPGVPWSAPPISRFTCCAFPWRRNARSNPASPTTTAPARNARSRTNLKNRKIRFCASFNAHPQCALYWCTKLRPAHHSTHFGSKFPV